MKKILSFLLLQYIFLLLLELVSIDGKITHLCRLVQFIKRKDKKAGQVLKAELEQIKKSRAKDWGFADPLLLGATHTFTSKVLLHLHFSECKKELAIYSEKNLTTFS